jgi:hypothetical protein
MAKTAPMKEFVLNSVDGRFRLRVILKEGGVIHLHPYNADIYMYDGARNGRRLVSSHLMYSGKKEKKPEMALAKFKEILGQ